MTGELEVSNLSAGYGRIAVVFDAAFVVRAGELVALLGRNGAGKTTALLAVAGLSYGPGSRMVKVDGLDVSRHHAHAIVAAGVNLVPEGRRIFRDMTVEENLRLGAFTRRRAGSRSIAADLERVHELFPALATARAKRAGELSGGQQQMVAIGQAIMAAPTLLLMDEPSAGLAPSVIDDLAGHLADLRETGLTLLVVEQRTAFTREISDRIWVMQRGSMIISDMPAQECTDEKLASIFLGGSGD
jgi:branched-chain amino acid transport system ATP-binding protein